MIVRSFCIPDDIEAAAKHILDERVRFIAILIPDDYLVDGFANTMPTNFGKELTSEELTSVVAYLMTLK